jgi:membrane protein
VPKGLSREAQPLSVRSWRALADRTGPTVRFLTATEAHVYAFSIAANVLLSFFPFLLTLILLCRWVFHWERGVQAILFAVSNCFPDYHGGAYLDISGLLNHAAWAHRRVSMLSLLMLFFTANGIFEPFEVALNRAWKVKKNRSYLRNQLVSLGLIFLCGILVLLSTLLFAGNGGIVSQTIKAGFVGDFSSSILFKLAALPPSALIIFLVYWILPNRRIPAKPLIPVSIVVGMLLTALNYLNLLTWPWLFVKLKGEAGPFVHSASIILWSFFAALVVLAGAEWSARVTLGKELLHQESVDERAAEIAPSGAGVVADNDARDTQKKDLS